MKIELELDEDEVIALRRSAGRYLTRIKESGPATSVRPAETLYDKVMAATGGNGGQVFACRR
jgi:hypothetical protein